MEERWRRRQSESRPATETAPRGVQVPAGGPLGEDQWRQLQATHLQRQSRAIESIRTYVAIWFWLTIIGALLLAFASR